MSLLNKRLLKNTLNKQKDLVTDLTKEKLKKLFSETLKRIESKQFKTEESEKVPFLQCMFELLGYKLHEDLEFEFSIAGRSIDGVLGKQNEATKNRIVEIAIEWKGIDIKSLDKGKAGETPVSQMWDYMGKTNAGFGIVGNFLEWRLYTKDASQTNFQVFNLKEIAQSEDKLIELIFFLKPETLLRGQNKTCFLEELIRDSIVEQKQITQDFYNDYKQRRISLFKHLTENNQQKNKYLLLEKTQKILDRLVFIRFCEDGFLLPNNILNQTFELAKKSRNRSEVKIWKEFQYLFEDIDKGRYDINPQINAFNGGLFSEDTELNSLIIKNNIWANLMKLADYDFESDLNVNILGHIFEKSISDIEELRNQIESTEQLVEKENKKLLKRKKDGVFYTPEYITKYIVEKTIGEHLEKYPEKLKTLKVLDPTCGSGAFLNQAHNFLVAKWQEFYETGKVEAENAKLGELFDYNPVERDKSILNQNLFGIDLQPESVEISKLSLWLKTARKDQKLNNLDENIKCGNSLISDPTITDNKGFDWVKEGWQDFDVIMGNPPYFNIDTFGSGSPIFEYLKKNYAETYMDKSDILFYFIQKSISLLSERGLLGFIISNAFLFSTQAKKLRNYILEKCWVLEIVNFEQYHVFEDADITTCILILQKKPKLTIMPPSLISEEVGKPPNPLKGEYSENLVELKISNSADKHLYSILKTKAKEMRHNPTKAEKILWDILKNGLVPIDNTITPPSGGWGAKTCKFRRQHIIARYIVDFYCSQNNLIIELDGEIHEYQKEEDNFRQENLNNLGCTIIRFTNKEVLEDLDSVLDKIKKIIREKPHIKPPSLISSELEMSNSIPQTIIEENENSPFSGLEGKTKAYNFTEKEYDKEFILTTLRNKTNFFEAELERDKPFALINNKTNLLNKKIDSNYPKLGDLFKIGKGMETAANEVFVFNEYPNQFPSEFIRKRMSGEIIEKYTHQEPIEYLLYFEGESSFETLPNSLKEHLEKHQEKLKKRAEIKRNTSRDWWKYSFPLHKEFYNLPKIWCSYRAKENCFCLDETPEFIGLTNTTVIFGNNDNYNLKYVLALLNSKVLNFRYKSIGKQTGNGIFEYFENQISQLPIVPADQEKQNEIAELIDKIISIKQSKGIQINKTLKFIESNFKLKEISTNLKKFYDLDFSEFILELEKQKVELKLKQKEELQEYFENKKNEVLKLQKEIEKEIEKIEIEIEKLYGFGSIQAEFH
jgi:very-short-patch-repair endonuclease/type I restriction-modification system DNA methylase subunit